MKKYFLEISNDLFNNLGNIDRVQVAPEEGVDINNKIAKPSNGIQGESSDLAILYKAPEPYQHLIPFSQHLKNVKHDKKYPNLFDMLSKVNNNLPILDVIRNVPSYAKTIKELNTKRIKYETNERVILLEVASVVLQ